MIIRHVRRRPWALSEVPTLAMPSRQIRREMSMAEPSTIPPTTLVITSRRMGRVL